VYRFVLALCWAVPFGPVASAALPQSTLTLPQSTLAAARSFADAAAEFRNHKWDDGTPYYNAVVVFVGQPALDRIDGYWNWLPAVEKTFEGVAWNTGVVIFVPEKRGSEWTIRRAVTLPGNPTDREIYRAWGDAEYPRHRAAPVMSPGTGTCRCGCADGDVCTCAVCPDGRDYASARAAALAQNKPLVVFVGQNWYDVPGCLCVRSDDKVFKDMLKWETGALVMRPDGKDFHWWAVTGAATLDRIDAVLRPPMPQAPTQAVSAGYAQPPATVYWPPRAFPTTGFIGFGGRGFGGGRGGC
jgi:choline dehydrogenase-like flavoprotein